MEPCKYDDKMLEICENIAKILAKVDALDVRINGSLKKTEDHINEGKTWRATIVGIIVALVIQLVSFSFAYGQLFSTVTRNTKIIEHVLEMPK